MKNLKQTLLASTLFGLLASAVPVSAQTLLFSDAFTTDSSANWTVRGADAGAAADYNAFFAFRYDTNKFIRNGVTNTIPLSPSSTAGPATNGVKMYVNKNDATAAIAAINIYPNGQVFSNDFSFKFDMWLNYNGPAAGGSGSTEFGIFGIDQSGTLTNWQDGASFADGVWFGVTGEGGAAGDYRAYVGDGISAVVASSTAGGGFLDRDGDTIVEAESFFGSDPTNWPLNFMFSAPAFETPGVPGKQWVQMEIRQRTNNVGGHVVTWLMNNYVIAENTLGDLLGQVQGNVMLGNQDTFASIANPAVDNFVIYDNVRVYDLSGVAPLPVVTVVTNDDTATESPAGDNASFTISAFGATAPLTVSYKMTGLASNGVDYLTLPGAVLLNAGNGYSSNVTLTPINDATGETTEPAVMVLLGSTNYDLYTNISAIVYIVDDGDKPIASVSAFRRAAYEGNTNRSGLFQIGFSTPYSLGPVTVNYTLTGTAVNGTDYELLSSSVTMAAGATSTNIFVYPKDNASFTSNLTVNLRLLDGLNYTNNGAGTNATITIFNDDLPPAVATLFSDDFDVDSSANWNINGHSIPGTNNCDALFAVDYGTTYGIPSAPHSTGGTTLGLRLRANSIALGGALFAGISTSPKNQNFTGDYRMRVDWWPNFPGGLAAGGSGSTQLGLFGITRGSIPQWPGGVATADAVYFGMSGDGGTAPDIRAYTNAGAVVNVNTGVYAAGTASDAGNNNAASGYYNVFGNQDAPAAQLGLFPAQTGFTSLGAPGEIWHEVVVTKLGNAVIWTIDGLAMATLNAANLGINLSTNIFVGQTDINAGQSSAAAEPMQFGLFDNLKVESLPKPTVNITNILLAGSSAVLTFTGGTNDPAVAYNLLQAADVTGPYTNTTTAIITNVSSGVFRAVTTTNGDARYYRILR